MVLSSKHLDWVYNGAQFQTFGLSLQWCSVPNIWIEFTVVLGSKHLDWGYSGAQPQTIGLGFQWCLASNIWIGLTVVFSPKTFGLGWQWCSVPNICFGFIVVLNPKYLVWFLNVLDSGYVGFTLYWIFLTQQTKTHNTSKHTLSLKLNIHVVWNYNRSTNYLNYLTDLYIVIRS
jgi:hypothetical protein